MGIHGFWKLVEGTELKLKDLRGLRLAVDASTEIYRAVLGMRNINALTTEEGEPTAHINTLLSSITRLLHNRTDMIWVFDGKSHPAKQAELTRRAEIKAQARASGDDRRSFGVTRKMVEDVKHILNGLGVSYTTAPDGIDAEHVCACMTTNGDATHVLTTDADTLLYGAVAVIKMEKRKFIEYRAEDIMSQLDLDRDGLVRVGMCLGTDFAQKIPRIGIKTVVAKCKLPNIVEKYNDHHHTATSIFMSACPSWELTNPTPDNDKLVAWLVAKSFNGDRVRKLIARCSS